MGLSELIGAVVAKLLAGEFQAFAPSLSRLILRFAVRLLQADMRERFDEEWHGRMEEIPGKLAKLGFALGCGVAGVRVGGPTIAIRASERILNFIVAFGVIAFLAPALVFLGIGVLMATGKVFYRHPVRSEDGKEIRVLRFFTGGNAGLRNPFLKFMRRASFNELPELFDILEGRSRLFRFIRR